MNPSTGNQRSSRNKTGLDAATAVEIQRHYNELRREFLNDRAKTLDWWLAVVGISLTAIGIFAVLFGYIGIKEFKDIRDEARQYADEAQQKVENIKKHEKVAQHFTE